MSNVSNIVVNKRGVYLLRGWKELSPRVRRASRVMLDNGLCAESVNLDDADIIEICTAMPGRPYTRRYVSLRGGKDWRSLAETFDAVYEAGRERVHSEIRRLIGT